jgi:hypothetical protein
VVFEHASNAFDLGLAHLAYHDPDLGDLLQQPDILCLLQGSEALKLLLGHDLEGHLAFELSLREQVGDLLKLKFVRLKFLASLLVYSHV